MRTLKWTILAALAGVAVVVVTFACSSDADEGQADYEAIPMLTTPQDFQRVLDSPRPAFVDFYADWCGPCRQLAPTIGSLSREYGDRVDFYRVNVDVARELAQQQGIESIPTLLLVTNGQGRRVAARDRQALATVLQSAAPSATTSAPARGDL